MVESATVVPQQVKDERYERAMKTLRELYGSIPPQRRLTKEERDEIAREATKDIPTQIKIFRRAGLL